MNIEVPHQAGYDQALMKRNAHKFAQKFHPQARKNFFLKCLAVFLLFPVTFLFLPARISATDAKVKLNSADGSTSFQVTDNADVLKAQIDSQGNLLIIGTASIVGADGLVTTGRVGIRTAGTPTDTLDVDGTAMVRGTVSVEGAGLYGSGRAFFAVRTGTFSVGYDGVTYGSEFIVNTTSMAGNPLYLNMTDNSVFTSNWYFAPSRCGSCHTPGSDTGDLILRSVNYRSLIFNANSGQSFSTYISSTQAGVRVPATPTALFQVGGGSLSVSQTGRLGINTKNPGAKLQVWSPAGSSEIQVKVTTGDYKLFEVTPASVTLGVNTSIKGELRVEKPGALELFRISDPATARYLALGLDAANGFGRIDLTAGNLAYMLLVTTESSTASNAYSGVLLYDNYNGSKRLSYFTDWSQDNWYWAMTSDSFATRKGRLNIQGDLATLSPMISSGTTGSNYFAAPVGIGPNAKTAQALLDVELGSITIRGTNAGLRILGNAGLSQQKLIYVSTGSTNYFRVSSTGTVNVYGRGAYQSSGADFAEYYFSDEKLEPGDLVMNAGQQKVQRSEGKGSSAQLMGVVSVQPGFVAGSPGDSPLLVAAELAPDSIRGLAPAVKDGDRKGRSYNHLAYPIALAGRTPVKVSLENGPVKVGDYLTASSKPGYAMKANQSGRVVGVALESYSKKRKGKEQILLFLNPHHWTNPKEHEQFADQYKQEEQSYLELQQELKSLRSELKELDSQGGPEQ